MLFFMVFERFFDFMGGGTPHEMMIFSRTSCIFVARPEVFPGGELREVMGLNQGGDPPMKRWGDMKAQSESRRK